MCVEEKEDTKRGRQEERRHPPPQSRYFYIQAMLCSNLPFYLGYLSYQSQILALVGFPTTQFL